MFSRPHARVTAPIGGAIDQTQGAPSSLCGPLGSRMVHAHLLQPTAAAAVDIEGNLALQQAVFNMILNQPAGNPLEVRILNTILAQLTSAAASAAAAGMIYPPAPAALAPPSGGPCLGGGDSYPAAAGCGYLPGAAMPSLTQQQTPAAAAAAAGVGLQPEFCHYYPAMGAAEFHPAAPGGGYLPGAAMPSLTQQIHLGQGIQPDLPMQLSGGAGRSDLDVARATPPPFPQIPPATAAAGGMGFVPTSGPYPLPRGNPTVGNIGGNGSCPPAGGGGYSEGAAPSGATMQGQLGQGNQPDTAMRMGGRPGSSSPYLASATPPPYPQVWSPAYVMIYAL